MEEGGMVVGFIMMTVNGMVVIQHVEENKFIQTLLGLS